MASHSIKLCREGTRWRGVAAERTRVPAGASCELQASISKMTHLEIDIDRHSGDLAELAELMTRQMRQLSAERGLVA